MEEIIKEFEEMCGNLSISNDSPSEELIKEYFDRYAELKQFSSQGVSCSLRHNEDDMLKAYQAGYLENVDASAMLTKIEDLLELKQEGVKWYKRYTRPFANSKNG